MNTKTALLLVLVLAFGRLKAQQEIPLYPGAAPGSENWDWKEGETSNTPIRMRIVYNVVRPTLTIYRPDSANGSAVILFPGGGGYVLNIDHEGHNPAKQLVKKGITVFVLKYRTGRTVTDDPWNEMMGHLRDTAFKTKMAALRPLTTADATAAIRYIRSQAAALGINKNKIGVAGFSAGGSLAFRLCTADDAEVRPDFAALIYSVYPLAATDSLPSTVPPVFIAAASDDVLAPSSNSISFYNAWLKAKRPAELHLYAKGGHGLRGSSSSASWIRRFEDWLVELGK